MATQQATILTYIGAQIAIDAAVLHANKLGIDMNIAVVDQGCNLIAFIRMPQAKVTGIQLAIDKVFTAAGHRVPSSRFATLKESTYTALNQSNRGRFAAIGGGLPIFSRTGDVLGGIGCGSGTPEQDEEAASAGRSAVERLL